jgi:hypothetical protein
MVQSGPAPPAHVVSRVSTNVHLRVNVSRLVSTDVLNLKSLQVVAYFSRRFHGHRDPDCLHPVGD